MNETAEKKKERVEFYWKFNYLMFDHSLLIME